MSPLILQSLERSIDKIFILSIKNLMNNRICNITILTILFIFCCIESTSYIKAANRSDTTFSFSLNPSGNKKDYDHSSWRSKDNSSAIYMKVNTLKYPKNDTKVWAQGKKYSDSSNYYDCSGGHFIRITKKGVYYLPNTVKQSKYGYARIGAQADPHAKNSLNGVWSPDSGKNIQP